MAVKSLAWTSDPECPCTRSYSVYLEVRFTYTAPLDRWYNWAFPGKSIRLHLGLAGQETSLIQHRLIYHTQKFAERAPHFHIDVISIGCSNRHVMHALLAASALHIRFTRHPNLIATTAIDPAPSTLISCLTTPSSTDPFASVEAGHHLSASRLFRIALETFYTPTPYNDADMTSTSTTPTPFSTPQTPQIDIDPLLTTCMLLNMLSFAGLPEAGPPQSRWPFTQIPTPTTPPHARPLNWLRIQLGFSPILSNLTMHMKQTSQWLAFFMTLGHEVFYDDRTGTASIPASFCEFFGINEHSTIENHKYLRLVRRLVAILAVWQRTEAEGGGGARHDEQVLRYLQFMQGVDEVFLTRLEGRTDVRCLVTYGWFMAVLSYVRHWWCRVRAVRECQGVVEWLDGWCAGEWRLEGGRWEMTGNQTGFWADEEEEEERKRVKPWLPYMARAVGYELRRWDGGRQEEIQVGDGF